MKKFYLIAFAVVASLAFMPATSEACCILRGIARGVGRLFGH